MRAVQFSCRRYQPNGVSRALPMRSAWGSSGSLRVVGVRGGCGVSGVVWRDGVSGSGTFASMCQRSLAGVAGLGGATWSGGRDAADLGCHR